MYQVVPFSQRSGVLEWCSGTVPIGEFLVDPQKGAHKRFRPQDWPNMSCRKKMMVGNFIGLFHFHSAYSLLQAWTINSPKPFCKSRRILVFCRAALQLVS